MCAIVTYIWKLQTLCISVVKTYTRESICKTEIVTKKLPVQERMKVINFFERPFWCSFGLYLYCNLVCRCYIRNLFFLYYIIFPFFLKFYQKSSKRTNKMTTINKERWYVKKTSFVTISVSQTTRSLVILYEINITYLISLRRWFKDHSVCASVNWMIYINYDKFVKRR